VDSPEDLQRLVSLPGETRAQQLARKWSTTTRVGTAASAVQPRSGE
jgi:hypothetical protein